MRGVFFGVEAILYSFTLPQRFWQVTSAIAQSTEIPTEDRWLVGASVLLLIVEAIAPLTYHLLAIAVKIPGDWKSRLYKRSSPTQTSR
jgi:hypothetical protein